MARLAMASVACQIAAAPAIAGESAVILAYHRFGEPAYPSTNVRLDQFEAQIGELASGGYTVLPLPDIVAALAAGRALPNKTVGISIDDGYLSAYREAWPRLRAAGFPFTVFVATDAIDRRRPAVMTWDQIRELARAGVTVGAHSAGHVHLVEKSPSEIREEVERSNARLRAELGSAPTLFAYPYGETGHAVSALIRQIGGYTAAFGQHSGAMSPASDFLYLPRFLVNEELGDMDRFRMAAGALPLPVRDISPADPLLGALDNPPAFGFTLGPNVAAGLRDLACYSSHEGRVPIEHMGARRIAVRINRPFSPGRGRINCTMPGPDGRWRWFGTQFYVRKAPR